MQLDLKGHRPGGPGVRQRDRGGVVLAASPRDSPRPSPRGSPAPSFKARGPSALRHRGAGSVDDGPAVVGGNGSFTGGSVASLRSGSRSPVPSQQTRVEKECAPELTPEESQLRELEAKCSAVYDEVRSAAAWPPLPAPERNAAAAPERPRAPPSAPERAATAPPQIDACLHQIETFEHIETRTKEENHARNGVVAELRRQRAQLLHEAVEVEALADEANAAMRVARRQLSAAKEAIEERRRSYEDCKTARSAVAEEKRKEAAMSAERAKAGRDARLDGQGDLDTMDEMTLLQRVQSMEAEAVVGNMAKEHQSSAVSGGHVTSAFPLRHDYPDPDPRATRGRPCAHPPPRRPRLAAAATP